MQEKKFEKTLNGKWKKKLAKFDPLIIHFSRGKTSQAYTLLIRFKKRILREKMSSIKGATQSRHFIFIESSCCRSDNIEISSQTSFLLRRLFSFLNPTFFILKVFVFIRWRNHKLINALRKISICSVFRKNTIQFQRK